MEKKNYEFKAFTSKGKEIELCNGDCIYKCTKEEAGRLMLGIVIGLQVKYKDPLVRFREV